MGEGHNHATYKSQQKATIEDELAGRRPLSQFERGAKELGMKFIHARSPQAKGRIERLFKTFQDRVIKEMRLANISSIREGNQFLRIYLPKYNKKFNVTAKEITDLHRKIPEDIDLDAYLCIKTRRIIRNDYTVAYDRKLYQITSRTKAKKVTVEERISGKIVLREDSGYLLENNEIKSRPKKKPEKKRKSKRRYQSKDESHPWKKWIERGSPQNPVYAQRKKKEAKKKEKRLLLVH